MHQPFGYDKYGREVEEELQALYIAFEYVLDGSMSLREAADWITGHTGRAISHSGFSARMKKEIGRLQNDVQEESGSDRQGREVSEESSTDQAEG
jgi:hypothetical protein